MRKVGDHAVVLGASMGGLLAARVLADAFRRVTLVERDPLPESGWTVRGFPRAARPRAVAARGADPRRAVPRAAARHGRGRCPGAARSAGVRFLSGAICCARTANPASQRMRSAGRLLNEVRDRVRALGNVSIRDRCEVTGLVTTPARDRVTGARVLTGAGAAPKRSRRRSRRRRDRPGRPYPSVAAELGYDPPAEEQLRVDIKYASRYCSCAPERSGTKSWS